MEEDKVKNVINIIKYMNIKDKLRLAICMFDGTKYQKPYKY